MWNPAIYPSKNTDRSAVEVSEFGTRKAEHSARAAHDHVVSGRRRRHRRQQRRGEQLGAEPQRLRQHGVEHVVDAGGDGGQAARDDAGRQCASLELVVVVLNDTVLFEIARTFCGIVRTVLMCCVCAQCPFGRGLWWAPACCSCWWPRATATAAARGAAPKVRYCMMCTYSYEHLCLKKETRALCEVPKDSEYSGPHSKYCTVQ